MIVVKEWREMNPDLHVLRVVVQVPSDGVVSETLILRAYAREHSYDVQTADYCVLARGSAETLKEAKVEALIQLRTLVGSLLEQLCESARLNKADK